MSLPKPGVKPVCSKYMIELSIEGSAIEDSAIENSVVLP